MPDFSSAFDKVAAGLVIVELRLDGWAPMDSVPAGAGVVCSESGECSSEHRGYPVSRRNSNRAIGR